MKAIKFILILCAIALPLITGFSQFGEEIIFDPEGNPDVGLPRGPYRITWRDNGDASTKFRLEWIGSIPGGRCFINVSAHCVSDGRLAPPVGHVYMLEGTQKFLPENDKYQDILWDRTDEMVCEAFSPLTWKNPLPPPCCTTCQACFWKVDMTNNNKILQNLGCLDYTDVSGGKTPEILSTVSLSSGQGLKMVTSCEDGSCPQLTVYENGKLVTSDKFNDCNGISGCKDIGFATNVVPIDYYYWERGCKCQVQARAIDP